LLTDVKILIMKTRILSYCPLLSLVVLFSLSAVTTSAQNQGKYFDISKNIELFTNIYKELNTHYVDDLDPASLMRIGVDAMMTSLDPYTNYISETDIEGYRILSEGKYNGFGARIEIVGDQLTIIEPYENSPALNAGLKAGDRILEVEGESAAGKSPEEVDAILRGFPGTEVTLKIQRPGDKTTFEVSLSREQVNIPNVPYSATIADGIGYITLTTFTRNAGANIQRALREIEEENPDLKGVILDLRNNGGGLLMEAVNICNIFIPKGEVVVATRGKVAERDRTFKTNNPPHNTEVPIVVLINNRSASASEIVSGVIQDYDRGILLGQRSYGKGLVQNTREVGYNSKIKLTTAKYYIPSGRCIQSVEYENGEPVDIPEDQRARFTTRNGRTVLDGGGVRPDVEVPARTNTPIIKALQDQFLIFDYVTDFCTNIDSLPDVTEFYFEEWDGFKSYLKKRDFTFETATEKALQEIQEHAKEENLNLDKLVQEMEDQIAAEKAVALEANKVAIVDLIEKDVASRFQYQSGKAQIGLRNDPEVKEAIELLNDPDRYQKILKKK
jgi:carboxyl-terminal processing protease